MTDVTGTSPDEWALWRSFLAVQALLTREIDGQLRRDNDIGQGEYGALAAILEAPDRRLRIGTLAELLGWERSRASHLVSRLEKRGLVRREECADDARATDIKMTRAGARTLLSAVRGHAAVVRTTFLNQMTPEESMVLKTVLDRILTELRLARPQGVASSAERAR